MAGFAAPLLLALRLLLLQMMMALLLLRTMMMALLLLPLLLLRMMTALLALLALLLMPELAALPCLHLRLPRQWLASRAQQAAPRPSPAAVAVARARIAWCCPWHACARRLGPRLYPPPTCTHAHTRTRPSAHCLPCLRTVHHRPGCTTHAPARA